MRENEYVRFLRSRSLAEVSIRSALDYVSEFEKHLIGAGKNLESVDVSDVKQYASKLMAEKKNTMERFLALARYVYMGGLNEVFIYFTSILGG